MSSPEQAAPAEAPELAPVRPGEEFDVERVHAWLRANVPGTEKPFEVLQFPGGHANLTYLLRFPDRELVLRRPPLGPVAPRSHDMAREFRVLEPLSRVFDPAPRAHALCTDLDVLGVVFIVMERCRGSVARTQIPPDLAARPDAARRMSETLIDVIADFHAVDYHAIGLGDLGRPEGYASRQVEGWRGRWEAARDVEIPRFDAVHAWLVRELPASPGASLVHNDLKFDNVMFEHGNPDRITAILDWDMTTLGDPLVDLGTLLGYWAEPGDPKARGATNAMTAQPGFLSRDEIAQRYAQRRGIGLDKIAWYEAFALWKTAVVLQQIYIRYVRGQTRDERFAEMAPRIPALIDLAADVAGL